MRRHTPECEAAARARAAAFAEYRRRWPASCRLCAGNGGVFSSYDPSPRGVGLSSGFLEDFDPCDGCLGRGRCPRCAGPVPEECGAGAPDAPPCPGCGWTGCGPDDTAPPPGECCCYEMLLDLLDLDEEASR